MGTLFYFVSGHSQLTNQHRNLWQNYLLRLFASIPAKKLILISRIMRLKYANLKKNSSLRSEMLPFVPVIWVAHNCGTHTFPLPAYTRKLAVRRLSSRPVGNVIKGESRRLAHTSARSYLHKSYLHIAELCLMQLPEMRVIDIAFVFLCFSATADRQTERREQAPFCRQHV